MLTSGVLGKRFDDIAASLITNRYAGVIMGDDKQEVRVVIAGYTPTPGMPERTEEEEA